MAASATRSATRPDAVNILTATQRGLRSRRQRLSFWTANLPRWTAENVFNRRPLATTLKGLDFIHAAAFYDIATFPRYPGVVPENNEFRWVLFVSNFDGGWEPYRDSFFEAYAHGVHSLWGRSLGFPGFPGPASRYELEEWSDLRLVPSNHFYCAYPGATSHDIRAAARVSREVRGFLTQTVNTPQPYRPGSRDLARLLHRLQNCLGQLEPVTRAWPRPGPIGVNGMTSLACLTPIEPGCEAKLGRALKSLGDQRPRPFALVPGTHFARLAIVHQLLAGVHPHRYIQLANSWLLLAVDFDACVTPSEHREDRPPELEMRRYFESMAAVPALADVWDHCQARRQIPSLADYLLLGVRDRFVQFRDYPALTLHEVLRSMEVHDLVRRRVLGDSLASDEDIAALRDELAQLTTS